MRTMSINESEGKQYAAGETGSKLHRQEGLKEEIPKSRNRSAADQTAEQRPRQSQRCQRWTTRSQLVFSPNHHLITTTNFQPVQCRTIGHILTAHKHFILAHPSSSDLESGCWRQFSTCGVRSEPQTEGLCIFVSERRSSFQRGFMTWRVY
jgi:hypothetical protein